MGTPPIMPDERLTSAASPLTFAVLIWPPGTDGLPDGRVGKLPVTSFHAPPASSEIKIRVEFHARTLLPCAVIDRFFPSAGKPLPPPILVQFVPSSVERKRPSEQAR